MAHSATQTAIRARAIDALADMASGAAGAIPELTGALGDEDDDVRRRAAEALGLVGQNCQAGGMPWAASEAAVLAGRLAACLGAADETSDVRREA